MMATSTSVSSIGNANTPAIGATSHQPPSRLKKVAAIAAIVGAVALAVLTIGGLAVLCQCFPPAWAVGAACAIGGGLSLAAARTAKPDSAARKVFYALTATFCSPVIIALLPSIGLLAFGVSVLSKKADKQS